MALQIDSYNGYTTVGAVLDHCLINKRCPTFIDRQLGAHAVAAVGGLELLEADGALVTLDAVVGAGVGRRALARHALRVDHPASHTRACAYELSEWFR